MPTPDYLSGTDEIEPQDLITVWSRRNRDARRVSFGQFQDGIDATVQAALTEPVESANAAAAIAQVSATSAAQSVVDAATVLTGAVKTIDLAAPSGAGAAGFSGALNYAAGTIGARLGSEINIKDFPWNCKCDGVTDDTVGFHAALTKAIATRGSLHHPGGVCRVTAGFNNALAQGSVLIRGNGMNREGFTSAASSVFQLDSTSPTSFFFKASANQHLQVRDITFSCAQYVLDRGYFIFAVGLHYQTFSNVNFEAVERPIVWQAGTYFQSGYFTNVQFRRSGTFHSEATDGALLGTLLVLDNVNHESTVPENTEKVLCNLQGIRQIQGRNVLLEGSLPSAGWTIIKTQNSFDPSYTRSPFCVLQTFHCEWAGTFRPLYTFDQIGGAARITEYIGLTSVSKHRLRSQAKIIIENTSYAGDPVSVENYFDREDYQCLIFFTTCAFTQADFRAPGFYHVNSHIAATDAGVGSGRVVISNDGLETLYRYQGGFIPTAAAGEVFFQSFGGGAQQPSTDALYGRKLVIPVIANALNFWVVVKSKGALRIGNQVVMRARAKLPTFTTGLWAFSAAVNGIGLPKVYYGPEFSGAIVDVVVPSVLKIDAERIAFNLDKGTTTDASGNLEIYFFDICQGNSIAPAVFPVYQPQIVTYATAAPTVGTWAAGDRVVNSAPSAGNPKAWVCTVAGSPGTWVSEGNL